MNDRLRLVLLSFLMLFVELALIRWTGSNVVYLSYFSNFVLLGSFLGIGLGFLRAGKRNLFPWAPVALAGLVAFVRFFPVDINVSGSELIYFGGLETSGPPRALVLTIVFLAVAATMAFIAEGVAVTFARFEPLEAYRLDLVGSVLGIVGFSVLSFVRAPPVVWGVVAAVLMVVLLRPSMGAVQGIACAALIALLAVESFAADSSWSPYYKVVVRPDPGAENQPFVWVNGVPHQAIRRSRENPLYTVVYDRARPRSLDDVLIVGAGGGNDVSVALAKGAQRIDAVEIDPRLYELGKDLHPERPYDDPRVDIHIDDGRAFLERTSNRYDLILFALPDSITLLPGQSALRLESYLFTREAVAEAKEHLKPGGAFAMYNYYREDWLEQRFARTLDDVYGSPPCVHTIGGGVNRLGVLVASAEASSIDCNSPYASDSLASWAPAAATDDHPFPYLRNRKLPALYVQAIVLILLASLALVRFSAGPLRSMRNYADLFFMGAAFLLLETKNVVQFALLFGTTWFVNALVFTGILLVVLAAVEVSRRVSLRRPTLLYSALLGSVAVAFTVPPDRLLALHVVPRFFAATALAFAPIFLANLVFTQRFKDVGSSTVAFGANLLGAMVGGLVEYASLVVGYRALLVLVVLLYGLAFVFGRQHLRVPHPAAVASASR
jgi:hypothetical protein